MGPKGKLQEEEKNEEEVSPPLDILRQLEWLQNRNKVKQREVGPGNHHENGHDIFDGRAASAAQSLGEGPKTRVVSAESPGGHRPKTVAESIEQVHTATNQNHGQDDRQHAVDPGKTPSGSLHSFRGTFLSGPWHLGSH